jgi:predicted porin
MGYVAPSVSLGVNSPNFYLFVNAGTAGTFTTIDVDTGDANKMTYFTPRFSGFQLGVSYTPNNDTPANSRQSSGLSLDDQVGDHSDFFGVGVNYVQTLNNFDIAVSGGYSNGNLEDNAGGVFDDLEVLGFGLNVGFAGFTVGGSYMQSNNGFDDSKADTTAFDLGASYETGPWGVSFTYINSETNLLSNWNSDELDQFEIGLSYAMGPGVKLVASGQYLDENNDSASDMDGVAFAVGTMLSF